MLVVVVVVVVGVPTNHVQVIVPQLSRLKSTLRICSLQQGVTCKWPTFPLHSFVYVQTQTHAIRFPAVSDPFILFSWGEALTFRFKTAASIPARMKTSDSKTHKRDGWWYLLQNTEKTKHKPHYVRFWINDFDQVWEVTGTRVWMLQDTSSIAVVNWAFLVGICKKE